MVRKRNRWERFARQEPEWYILSADRDYRTPEDKAWFFQTGERGVRRILAQIDTHLPGRSCALEIGCGVGRLAIPLAIHFQRVLAVDIAPTMLQLLRENCRERGITNLDTFLPEEPWERRHVVDFALSHLVFRHIESFDDIEDYLRRVRCCLRAEGVFYFQVDTRPRTLAYHARNHVPDFALPRQWRRGMRGIRRDTSRIREVTRRLGFETVAERNPGTAHHVFILRKS